MATSILKHSHHYCLSLPTQSKSFSKQLRRITCCRARRGNVACKAEANLQDVIVGGFVVASISAALYGGLRKDPVTCDLCLGTGGTKCFGCNGEGKMLISKEDLSSNAARQRGKRRCRVCKGPGTVLCSKCKGSGFITE